MSLYQPAVCREYSLFRLLNALGRDIAIVIRHPRSPDGARLHIASPMSSTPPSDKRNGRLYSGHRSLGRCPPSAGRSRLGGPTRKTATVRPFSPGIRTKGSSTMTTTGL